ncbi:hypothetical protein G9A89_020130 [Geosiphon pyriformis]|nr:hypothetical protein G9A89_020130 [Geosiphon pyriformis]
MAEYAKEAYCIPYKQEEWDSGLVASAHLKSSSSLLREIVIFIHHGYKPVWCERFMTIPNFKNFSLYGERDAGLVEQTFFTTYRQKEDYLIKLITDQIAEYTGKYTVHFTGHGAGGVYAIFAALSFHRKNPVIPIKVITFGAPRFGDQKFASYVAKNIPDLYRITNWNDPIPHVGFLDENYRHPHTEYWISRQEECNDCPEDRPIVYKCLPYPRINILNGYLEENPNCHGSTRKSYVKVSSNGNPRVHQGPYFGIEMKCNDVSKSLLFPRN